jgi:hypothetical protein
MAALTLRLQFDFPVQVLVQRTPRAGEPAHDRADRRIDD